MKFCRCSSATALLFIKFLFINFSGITSARTWDIAVTIGQEIDFLSTNGTVTGRTLISEATSLVGFAYDDSTHTMFLSDAKNQNFSIFTINLSEKNVTVKPLLKRRNSSMQVLGMAFESVTRTLFWTEENLLLKMYVPKKGFPLEPVIVHDLKGNSPRGIALDVCNKQIYWANSNRTNPSIERSNFDGSNRTVIISRNLYDPSSLIIDHQASKLYWIDDKEGVHYKIERSNLDSSDREILVHGKYQQPVSLAIDNDFIYWTDYVYRALWKIEKNVKPGDIPIIFKSYFDSNRDADPTTVITRDNIGSKISCKPAINNKKSNFKLPPPAATMESFNNLTSSTEEVDSREPFINCLNGIFSKEDGTCHCELGYGGLSCQTELCHNYCFRGNCVINNKGLPTCKCEASYAGSRCEKNVCDGYCLNDGICHMKNNKPTCECKYSNGNRCESTVNIEEICTIFCSNKEIQLSNLDTSSCRCSELSQTFEEVISYDNFKCTILVPLLSGFIGMLSIVIIILSIYINKLTRRPRIKKRFVVNKTGITPLTSRPQMMSDQCEITIENCCNMNICETPCFEPNLRSSSTKNKKKEEKSNLLDNIEVNS